MRHYRRAVLASAVVVLVVYLSACAGASHRSGGASYIDPAGVELQTVAVLPVLSNQGVEGFQRLVGESLTSSLEGRYTDPAVSIIPVDTTRQRLSDANLADVYASMIRDYKSTGVISSGAIDSLGQATGASHLVYTSVSYRETAHEWDGDFTQVMDASGIIFGVAKADVVWEGSASWTKKVNEQIEDAVPMKKMINSVIGRLVNSMPPR